jgi:hypothetical protein
MPISVTTSDQYNLSVVLNDGNTVNLTTAATSVAVTQASPINVTVSSKGPKGDPGPGAEGSTVVNTLNGMSGTVTIDGDGDVSVTADGEGNISVGYEFLYNNATEMPEEVGSFQAGTTFTDATLDNLFTGLLYPYQVPSFTASDDLPKTYYEVGEEVSSVIITLENLSNQQNIASESISIKNGGTTLVSGLSHTDFPYTHNFSPALTYTSPQSVRFTVEAKDTREDTITANTSYTYWRRRYFWGNVASETISASDLSTFDSYINDADPFRDYDFSAVNGGYQFFVWPTAFSIPGGFEEGPAQFPVVVTEDAFFTDTDTNGFSYGTITNTNSYGVSTTYRVYRSFNAQNGDVSVTVIQ